MSVKVVDLQGIEVGTGVIVGPCDFDVQLHYAPRAGMVRATLCVDGTLRMVDGTVLRPNGPEVKHQCPFRKKRVHAGRKRVVDASGEGAGKHPLAASEAHHHAEPAAPSTAQGSGSMMHTTGAHTTSSVEGDAKMSPATSNLRVHSDDHDTTRSWAYWDGHKTGGFETDSSSAASEEGTMVIPPDGARVKSEDDTMFGSDTAPKREHTPSSAHCVHLAKQLWHSALWINSHTALVVIRLLFHRLAHFQHVPPGADAADDRRRSLEVTFA